MGKNQLYENFDDDLEPSPSPTNFTPSPTNFTPSPSDLSEDIPSRTNPCPNVELAQKCNGPTDEILGYNCMALASSPCASGSDPFGVSLGNDPGSSGMPDDSKGEQIQNGLEVLYENVKNNEVAKIDLICTMLGLKDSNGDNIGKDDELPLSKEFYGCNKSVIDRLRNRCNVHEVPLIQCSLSYLNNLWNTCKKTNENDTKVFDTQICPHLLKNEDNYALKFLKKYIYMNNDEREETFSNDENLRKAWESEYILKKIPGTYEKIEREKQFSEDSDYVDKFFDELDVMQNCVLYDYTNPRHKKDYKNIKAFYEERNIELTEDGNDRLDNYSKYNLGSEGKFVNRFCDYGVPRPPGFYDYEDPLTIPDSSTVLDNMGEKIIIDDDEKRFSTYAGVYKCPPGTKIGDSDEGPYLDFEKMNKDCEGADCIVNNKIECLLQSVYYPDHDIDKQLSEDESQCYKHNTDDTENTELCPGEDNNCSNCKHSGDDRPFWNSNNCKIRPPNPNNIYGHSCEDDYAACVKVESPDELKKLKNQYTGQLKRDNTKYSNCNCMDKNCTDISTNGCEAEKPKINDNLDYPDLIPHNFLTDDMINDREKLFKKLNPTDPIYKCMRCGLRGTNQTGKEYIESDLQIFNSDEVKHSKHPDFLIFRTKIEPDNDNGDYKVSETNCTTNDLYWYQSQKGYLETRMHQDRTLFESEKSISIYKKALEDSEDNIKESAAIYTNERIKRQKMIDELRSDFEELTPDIDKFIKEAEIRVQEEYDSNVDELDDSSRHNYLFYIIGFVIFIILILFLVF